MAILTPISDLPADERPCVKTFTADKTIVIVTTPRCKPKMILPDMRGYKLGLYDSQWANHTPTASGAATYWVVVAPRFSGLTDNDGSDLLGTRCQNCHGVEVTFEPFPDGYACDGYSVYANDAVAEPTSYYYLGELNGRWNTHFTIGAAPTDTFAYAEDPTANPLAPDDVIGPPPWASQCEVYQGEGNIDTRVYLAGGKEYRRGYAKVATASGAALVTGGTNALSVVATWNAVTAGGFRMRINNEWFEIVGAALAGLDFSGAATMAAVAQIVADGINGAYAPVLHAIPTDQTIGTWTAITGGAFDVWIDGTKYSVRDCDFSLCATLTAAAAIIQTALQLQTSGSETCTWDTVNELFVIRGTTATALGRLSYLYPPSDGAGTDISALMGGRENSTGVVLNRLGKAASSISVAWATNRFEITHNSTGHEYRLSLLETPTEGAFADISGTGKLFCRGDETVVAGKLPASYTEGVTAYYSVIGLDCEWGEWAENMRIVFDGDETHYLVDRYISTTHLTLDSLYSGIGADTYCRYTLLPWSDQVYPSELGNPFNYQADNTIKVTTATNDIVTGLRVIGRNLAIWMRHHVHVLDAVNPLQPRLVTDRAGAITAESIVWDGSKYVFFDGVDFWQMLYNSVQLLDPENRMRDIVARINPEMFGEIVGVYDPRQDQKVVIWAVALDTSTRLDYAIVFHPGSGAWWLWHVQDMNALGVVYDEDEQPLLYSGSTYNLGRFSVNAFIFKHDADYDSDGAQDPVDGKTKSGIVNAVAAVSANSPGLTGGVMWATLATLQAVTSGAIEAVVEGESYVLTALNFSACATLAACATVISNALTAAGLSHSGFTIAGGASSLALTTYGADYTASFRAYEPETYTDLSAPEYLNVRDAASTHTVPTNLKRDISLYKADGATNAALNTTSGETGIWAYFCDTNYKNGSFAFVTAITAMAVTVTPFPTGCVAGWYWFLGGIDPTWEKWFDFGASHMKHKGRELAVTCTPETAAHVMAAHEMHNLSSTVRESVAMTFGSTADVTQTKRFSDRPATHIGIILHRPSSEVDLQVENIVITHRTEI